jgi:D-alanyl-lipoteichoic acid acyltransferase DltB (MBOAT superfamily)
MRNFAYPYFSRDIGEFWRRWHISLSSWFRDYVYIPLGGSRTSKSRWIINLIITFTVSGFWHGANWTFVIWGFLNGLFYLPLILGGNLKKPTDTVAQGRMFPSVKEAGQLLMTFILANLAWVFFRAENVAHAFSYIGRIFTAPYLTAGYGSYIEPLLLMVGMTMIEWFQRERQYGLDVARLPVVWRWAAYIGVIIVFMLFGGDKPQEFIYFQF